MRSQMALGEALATDIPRLLTSFPASTKREVLPSQQPESAPIQYRPSKLATEEFMSPPASSNYAKSHGEALLFLTNSNRFTSNKSFHPQQDQFPILIINKKTQLIHQLLCHPTNGICRSPLQQNNRSLVRLQPKSPPQSPTIERPQTTPADSIQPSIQLINIAWHGVKRRYNICTGISIIVSSETLLHGNPRSSLITAEMSTKKVSKGQGSRISLGLEKQSYAAVSATWDQPRIKAAARASSSKSPFYIAESPPIVPTRPSP
ncbi:hypothetical protein Nepgr_031732 [Nepenthes gracilis]|uniref:Uncharacterized protein n=1 Tax=Nepenthes gracilis TaxID=150966 RepID=A0AAD3TIP4_NEPGR|nr:hypothetical protein Nepgr_031732 [Nepenthes gracilis]